MAASGYEHTLSDPLGEIDSTVQRLHTNVFNSAFNARVKISAGEDNKAEMPEARQICWSKKHEGGQSVCRTPGHYRSFQSCVDIYESAIAGQPQENDGVERGSRRAEKQDTKPIVVWIGRSCDLADSRGIVGPLHQVQGICECQNDSAHGEGGDTVEISFGRLFSRPDWERQAFRQSTSSSNQDYYVTHLWLAARWTPAVPSQLAWHTLSRRLQLETKPVLEMPRVFLITGTSTGFGRHLVQIVIDAGDIAIGLSPNDTIPAGGLHADKLSATARNPSTLSFQNTTPKNYLAVKLDVTSTSDIDNAFSEALSKFGRVDVVINNAGYGLSGPFEELEDKDIRTQMEVNFFGLLNVTKKAMAVMREQEPSGGLIQQVTSIAGQQG